MHIALPVLNAILLALYATTPAREAPDLIVFQGIVVSQASCMKDLNVPDSTSCVVRCGKVRECQFCYWENGCVMCAEGIIKAQYPGKYIAIKNVDKITTNVCPSEKISMKYKPSSDNHGVTPNKYKSEFDSISEPSMTLTTTSTEKVMTTSPKKMCPDGGWTLIRNEWCIVMGYLNKDIPPFNQKQALELCQKLKGYQNNVISGLEFEEELEFIKNRTRSLWKRYDLGVWVNGQQAEACTDTEDCFPNKFSFDDPHLKNFTGYDWFQHSTGKILYGGEKTCVQAMFPKNNSDPRFKKSISCQMRYERG